ncbi:hypothetical protein [Pelosinus sp. sgz500959]|uniref:hypothetical protein n=1 Tax=Pelosinus sp. sgz500959 TaxID=3242472 RepID=UPI003671E9DE
MGFKIGEVESIGDPAGWSEVPDDRVVRTPCITGVYVEDLGCADDGAVVQCSITVTLDDYEVLRGYRRNKTPVTVVNHYGEIVVDAKFKINKVSFVDGAPYRLVEIEIYK